MPRTGTIQQLEPISLETLPTLPGHQATLQFPASVLGVWTFNQTLEDIVSNNDFVPNTGSVKYAEFNKYELIPNNFMTRYGLEFENNKNYSMNTVYLYDNSFTIAFWYYSPQTVGFTRHFLTKELEPKLAPIIYKGNFQETSTITTLTSSSFIICETGYSKTQNAIKLFITEDGSNISHTITSDSFTPGLHHVLITYIKYKGRIRIDIDGKPGISHSGPTTNIQKSSPFRINKVCPGYLSHKTTQIGARLFDLVFTSYASENNEALKATRYGYEHISYDNLFDARFEYFGISYSQPNTVSTTNIFIDGGNIFAARSNGKIIKGERPIWDKEFNFPDSNSLEFLTTSKTDDKRTISWTSSGLHLKGVSVKI